MKGVAAVSSDEAGRPPRATPPPVDGGGAGDMVTMGRDTPSVAVMPDIPESEAIVKGADEDGEGTAVPPADASLLVRGEQPRTAPNAFQRLPEAPVFRPSEEQWLDPIVYVRSIQAEASRFGICKVVPPPSWRPPPFQRPRGAFQTRVQAVHQLCHRRGFHERFMTFLRQFHRHRGDFETATATIPRIKGRVLDMALLFKTVMSVGGYKVVRATGNWRQIGLTKMRMLFTTSMSSNLRKAYARWLLPLENHEVARRGLQRVQQEPFDLQFERYASRSECAACLMARLKQRRGGGADAELPAAHPHSMRGVLSGSVRDRFCIECGDRWHRRCYLREAHEAVGESSPKRARSDEGATERSRFVCPTCDAYRRFGYADGANFEYREFASMAQGLKESWFRSVMSAGDAKLPLPQPDTATVEREYWRIVDGGDERCEVYYGSELDVNQTGSGLPRVGAKAARPPTDEALAQWEHYAKHPWNLNIFPLLKGSLLEALPARQSGITDPWLYLGMCFSTFCYHAEDSDMYSINYMHCGEGKLWYGCRGGEGAVRFEQAMRQCVPELFEAMPNLLYGMITMVNPVRLHQLGAPMCRAVQMPGEFIITFPQAYHGGFSLGLNAAEAVNFALTDWLPFGRQAAIRYRDMRREAPFTQEELVFSAVQREDFVSCYSKEDAVRVFAELRRMVREELALREAADDVAATSRRMSDPRVHEYVSSSSGSALTCCAHCLQPVFLSAIGCRCSSGRISCIRHALDTCDCHPSQRTLYYLYTAEELQRMAADVMQARAIRLATEHLGVPLGAECKGDGEPKVTGRRTEDEAVVRSAVRPRGDPIGAGRAAHAVPSKRVAAGREARERYRESASERSANSSAQVADEAELALRAAALAAKHPGPSPATETPSGSGGSRHPCGLRLLPAERGNEPIVLILRNDVA